MLVFPFKNIEECRLTYPYAILNTKYTSGKHDGVDLVSDGDKTIISISDGKVIRSDAKGSWGEHLCITIPDGRTIIYAHMAEGTRKVRVGDIVKVGQELGIMGNTGKSNGSHLHIEIQNNYYTAGDTSDITEFIGIKNIKTTEVGQIKLLEVEEEELRYNKVSEMPAYAQETIQTLITKGIIKGSDGKLDLSLDMIRLLIINYRAGLYK